MKKVVLLITVCTAFFVTSFSQNAENDTIIAYSEYSSFPDSIIAFGKNYLNVRYRSGGMSAAGFDCSGFTSYVYKNFGYKLARTSDGQANQLDKVKKGEWRRGDLVFFNGRKLGKRIGHVGMITDVNADGSFDFIHASVKGVRITNSEQNYYKLRYMGAGRVIADTNQLLKREKPIQNFEENEISVSQIFENQKETETLPQISVQNPQYHTVKACETLYYIARKYGISQNDIRNYNGLGNNNIRVGQKLIVGGKSIDTQNVVKNQDTANNNTENEEKFLYIVQQGDTLYSISKVYGCSIEQIRQWNNKQSNELKIGEEILIFN